MFASTFCLCQSFGACQAINAAKSLDQDKLADYLRKRALKTIVGDGPNGESNQACVLQVQFHDAKVATSSSGRAPDSQKIAWSSQFCIPPNPNAHNLPRTTIRHAN